MRHHGAGKLERPRPRLLLLLCLCSASRTRSQGVGHVTAQLRAMLVLARHCTKWDNNRRNDCSEEQALDRAFAPDREALGDTRALACRAPLGAPHRLCYPKSLGVDVNEWKDSSIVAKQWLGAFPQLKFGKPQTIAPGGWEFDGNNRLDMMVYWGIFRGLGPRHRQRRFIEFGGQNGVFASNSRFFERFLGWQGMLIEPVCWSDLYRNRPLAKNIPAAICDDPGGIKLTGAFCREADSWRENSVGDRMLCPCTNVGHQIAEHFPDGVDFMSVDMEGLEDIALKQLNLTVDAATGLPTPRVGVLLIEWRRQDGSKRKDMLGGLGYTCILITNTINADRKNAQAGDELCWHPGVLAEMDGGAGLHRERLARSGGNEAELGGSL